MHNFFKVMSQTIRWHFGFFFFFLPCDMRKEHSTCINRTCFVPTLYTNCADDDQRKAQQTLITKRLAAEQTFNVSEYRLCFLIKCHFACLTWRRTRFCKQYPTMLLAHFIHILYKFLWRFLQHHHYIVVWRAMIWKKILCKHRISNSCKINCNDIRQAYFLLYPLKHRFQVKDFHVCTHFPKLMISNKFEDKK